MIDRVPWRPLAAVVGAMVLVIVAFAVPFEPEVSVRAEAVAVADTADGAAVAVPGPGVVDTPEPQPAADLPVPAAGTQPAQVVVVSVDGGCETGDGTIRRLMDVGAGVQGRFTFFLSGLCLLPDDAKEQYQAPGREPGVSDIPFASPELVAERIRVFSDMYRAGHEIGTHFLGHFCGPGGVDTWNAADWTSEINQAKTLLDTWPQNNPQVTGVDPLPFNSSVFAGDRTPCLEGARPAMHEAFVKAGFRYDASDPGTLVWPRKEPSGLWQFPLPALKLEGTDKWVLSMDYNLLVNQTDGETDVAPEECPAVEEQTYQTFMAALEGVYYGNRAPLILGTHLNDWVCNAYVNSLERFITDANARHPDVRFVSFQDLANWLEAMDPAQLAALQAQPEQRY